MEESQILQYLYKKGVANPIVAGNMTAKVTKYNDIKRELMSWLKVRKFPEENAVKIEGYSARDIAELAPFMDGVGVYNFMVDLRENPEAAKKYIADGFPIR